MGYLFRTDCFQTSAEATAAYYSSMPSALSGTTLAYWSWNGSAWRFITKKVESNGTLTNLGDVAAAAVSFPACDETQPFVDGMTLGWGVVLAMAIAWGFRQMRREAR